MTQNAHPHYQAAPHSSAGNARGAMSTPSSPMDPRMYSDDFNSVRGRASFSAVSNSTRRPSAEHSLQARRSSQPADMMAPSTLPPYPRLPTDFNLGQNYGYAAQPSGYGYSQSSTLDSSSIPRTVAPVSPSVAQYTYPSPTTSASSISAAHLSSGWPSRKRTRESEDAAVERSAKRARLGSGLAEGNVGETAAMGSLWHDDPLSSPAFLLNRPPVAEGKGLTEKELGLFHESVEWSISVYAIPQRAICI
ncbi:hypothetical protein PENSPDRAFT_650392 [Peniophora sp. CONT]|nr:hypothetical protein PENSPDRAFT_650392 [Peniophora sp. CONT]